MRMKAKHSCALFIRIMTLWPWKRPFGLVICSKMLRNTGLKDKHFCQKWILYKQSYPNLQWELKIRRGMQKKFFWAQYFLGQQWCVRAVCYSVCYLYTLRTRISVHAWLFTLQKKFSLHVLITRAIIQKI